MKLSIQQLKSELQALENEIKSSGIVRLTTNTIVSRKTQPLYTSLITLLNNVRKEKSGIHPGYYLLYKIVITGLITNILNLPGPGWYFCYRSEL